MTAPIDEFARIATAQNGVWRLATGTGSCEIPSMQPARYMGLFWISEEHARSAIPALATADLTFIPTWIELATFAFRWLWGMHEDRLLAGFCIESGLAPWEVEPLALFAALDAVGEPLLTNPEHVAHVREAARTPPVRWIAWPAWATGDLRPAPAFTAEAARHVLGLPIAAALDLLDELDELDDCDHSLARVRAWAERRGSDGEALAQGIRRLGLGCDCEVQLNLADRLAIVRP